MLDRLQAWLHNRSASLSPGHLDHILSILGLEPGDRIADYGSGGGYYALLFAEEVGPEGKVFAVDMKPAFLAFIRKRAKRSHFDNVETVLVPEIASRIPAGSLDLIFCRDAYHHLPDRTALFKDLGRYLKPEGRVAIIEWLPDAGRLLGPPKGHMTSPETIHNEMKHAGYFARERLDILPGHSFSIFMKERP
jgi:arsenite methyltransferase